MAETSGKEINKQAVPHKLFYLAFGFASLFLIVYYLSDTISHFTTPYQFPINSFGRFPLTILIFPAEIFSFSFALYFIYLLLFEPSSYPKMPNLLHKPDVAVLLPVYNEPDNILERTVKAVSELRWEGCINATIIDDSTDEVSLNQVDHLAKKYGLNVLRRKNRVGFKAGNINNAVSEIVKEDYFAIFDSDQAPEPEFLNETIGHFADPQVGFVQTPQYYVNESNALERAAKLSTNIFFHAQSKTKGKDKATMFCGTNAVIRTDAFRKVGGFSYYMSTEDIDLGLRLNQAGYFGVFVPKILVKGYGPSDFNAYQSQQYRWANGNLAVLRESLFSILSGNLSLRHQLHMIFTLSWWLIGVVSLIYITVPLLSLFFRAGTHHTWLPSAIVGFLYLHVAMGIFLIYVSLKNRVAGEEVRIRDAFLQYSLITNSMFIYIRAAAAVLFKKYVSFVRTNKCKTACGIASVKWNLILAGICFAGSIYALFFLARSVDIQQIRTYLPISLWLLFYSFVLSSAILFIDDMRATS